MSQPLGEPVSIPAVVRVTARLVFDLPMPGSTENKLATRLRAILHREYPEATIRWVYVTTAGTIEPWASDETPLAREELRQLREREREVRTQHRDGHEPFEDDMK